MDRYNTLRVVSTLLAASIPATTGLAADKDGQFAVKGGGGATCATFVNERNRGSERYALIRGWLEGYLTGVNELTPQTFDVAPWESTSALAALINEHCSKHPTDELMAVVMAVVRDLRPHRVVERSPLVDTKAAGDGRWIYEVTLQRAQRELTRRGFYSGADNGTFDKDTRGALAAFQKAEGLPVTSVPDDATLWRLLPSLPIGRPTTETQK